MNEEELVEKINEKKEFIETIRKTFKELAKNPMWLLYAYPHEFYYHENRVLFAHRQELDEMRKQLCEMRGE